MKLGILINSFRNEIIQIFSKQHCFDTYRGGIFTLHDKVHCVVMERVAWVDVDVCGQDSHPP